MTRKLTEGERVGVEKIFGEHDDSAERLVVLVAVATRKALHRHLVLRLQGEVVGGNIEWGEVLDAITGMDCFQVLDDLRVQERLAEVIVKPKESA